MNLKIIRQRILQIPQWAGISVLGALIILSVFADVHADIDIASFFGTSLYGSIITNNSGTIYYNNQDFQNFGELVFINTPFQNRASGVLTSSGTGGYGWLEIKGGTFSNTGITHTVNSGILLNTGTINNTGTLFFDTGGKIQSYGATINNSGTLELAAGGIYVFQSGTSLNTLNNTGTFILRRDFVLDGTTGGTVNLSAGGTVQNYASLTNATGHTQNNSGNIVNNIGGIFTNAGTFATLGGSSLLNAGNMINSGIIDTKSGATLTNSGSLTNNANSRLGNLGAIINSSGATLTNYGLLDGTRAQSLSNSGTLVNFSILRNGGVLDNNAGATLENSGTFTNNSMGHLNNYGSLTNLANGAFTSSGEMNNNAGATLTNSGAFTNNKIFNNNSGSLIVNTGTYTNVSGSILANSGTVTNGGAISNSGSITNDNILTNNAGATFTNSGTMNNHSTATLTNDGTLTNNAAGTLTNDGTLINNGTFNNNNGATIANTGAFTNISASTLNNAGTINNTGMFDLAAGSSFNGSGGTFTNNQGGTLLVHSDITFGDAAAGIINMTGASAVENYAGMTHVTNHTQDIAGVFVNHSGATLTNRGAINLSGIMENEPGARILNSGTFNAVPGSTFINDGIFDSTGGSFVNNGIIMGNGIYGGTLVNYGAVKPGKSIGTITADNFTNHGTLEIEVSGTASDRLIVTHKAILGGTVSFVPYGYIEPNKQYTYSFLQAGSIEGVFQTVNSPFYAKTLTYYPARVDVSFRLKPFTQLAGTENQAALAAVLDDAYGKQAMKDVTDSFLRLPDEESIHNSYNKISGLSHAAMPAVTFSIFNQYIDVLKMRMGGFLQGGTPSTASANPILLAARLDTGSDANNTLLTAAAAANTSAHRPTWGMWMQGYGGWGQRRADDLSARYDYNTLGMVAGFDKKVNEAFLVGATFGYSHTALTMKDVSEDAKVNSYQAALYGMYKAGSYYLNGIAAYAFNEHRTTRDIAFDTVARSASANYDGQIISGYIEGGYKITTPYVDIIPLAAIQVSHLTRNGFSEDGAGTLDLTADKETIASYIGSIGARITRTYRTKSGSVTPEFRIRWDHEFSNDGYILNASLAGNPGLAFQAVSDRPDTDRVAAGLGLAWQITKNASAHMSYEGYFSKSATQHGGGMAGFRYEF